MDSKIGLVIQFAGVSLITLLTLFLRRSVKVIALKHWTNAWLFLSFALFCLRLAFSYENYSVQLFSLYFLNEYIFGFLLVAGCRSLIGNNDIRLRNEIFILPFIFVAFGLPFIGDDFNLIYNAHCLILSGFFTVAFLALWRTKLNSFGWRVMLVALALLVLDFFQYFVVLTARQYLIINTDYLSYNSVIDLTLQILLGFGMVIVLLEQVLADAKVANEKLQVAHERLEELAHMDPLTAAQNRHAFHGYLKRQSDADQKVAGCVGFFDIDDLKDINDGNGHAVGDVAIRLVVRAIREVIRGEDLIFRWGGDEFFVIMIGLDAQVAYQRMDRMEALLTNVDVVGADRPLTIGVSRAFENFSDIADLENTIARADAMMYLNKQQRKAVKYGQVLQAQPSVRVEALISR
jgi:diguanylate cyclase (GGDEF)-like protein